MESKSDKNRSFQRSGNDGTSEGHFGVKRTLEKVREKFYWYRCKDVKEWCKKCAVCTAASGSYRIKKSLEGKSRIVHADRLTPLLGNYDDGNYRVRVCKVPEEISYEDFMARYSSRKKA